MKVLQTIAGFGALYGGIATCTYDLISAMHGIGFPLDLLTLEVRNPADKLMGKGEDWIKALPNDAITPYEYSRGIARYLKGHNYDLYHTNGLWMYCNHITCATARHKRKPYIITPHGMLYSDALHRSYWKKWPLIQLCFRNDIDRANCLHVTCKAEMGHVRNFGYKGFRLQGSYCHHTQPRQLTRLFRRGGSHEAVLSGVRSSEEAWLPREAAPQKEGREPSFWGGNVAPSARL